VIKREYFVGFLIMPDIDTVNVVGSCSFSTASFFTKSIEEIHDSVLEEITRDHEVPPDWVVITSMSRLK
jgi:hypothetical protein